MLLFHENLAARLVTDLAALYPGSLHVSDCGLAGGSDQGIWQYAREHGFVIVTKDEDSSIHKYWQTGTQLPRSRAVI
jgi:predicted nuclease of predicted toxin-antitoxin system